MSTTDEVVAIDASIRRWWWVSVAAGVVWILWGMFVLSYKPGALASLAVLIGISFILGAIDLFILSAHVRDWKWLWVLGGVLGIVAGIVVFFSPGDSLYVIAVFVAWYLAIAGIFTLIGAFTGPKGDWWWLGIVLGVLEIGLGVWAIGSPTRQILLLVNLMGFGMLFFGINQIVRGFTIRSLPSA